MNKDVSKFAQGKENKSSRINQLKTHNIKVLVERDGRDTELEFNIE